MLIEGSEFDPLSTRPGGVKTYRVVGLGDGIKGEGTTLELATTFYARSGGGLSFASVIRVKTEGAVRVKRTGFGNGAVERQVVRVTANESVPSYGASVAAAAVAGVASNSRDFDDSSNYASTENFGFFRLRWRHGKWGTGSLGAEGERLRGGGAEGDASSLAEHVTECIPYGATASEVQGAFNRLYVDFTDDGVLDYHDLDHVRVSRDGDGSKASGYGYAYTLEFSGRPHYRGLSTVLGDMEQVEVVGVGAAGGCSDLPTDDLELLLGVSASTNFSNGERSIAVVGDSLSGVLRPGDSVVVEGSSRPGRVYTVAAIHDGDGDVTRDGRGSGGGHHSSFSLTEAFSCDDREGADEDGGGCGEEKAVWKVATPATAAFSVETIVEGRAQWAYDVFFTNPILGDVAPLVVLEEGDGACAKADARDDSGTVTSSSGWNAYGGMVRDVSLKTVVNGGSAEVVTVSLSVDPPGTVGFFSEMNDGYYNDEVLSTNRTSFSTATGVASLRTYEDEILRADFSRAQADEAAYEADPSPPSNPGAGAFLMLFKYRVQSVGGSGPHAFDFDDDNVLEQAIPGESDTAGVVVLGSDGEQSTASLFEALSGGGTCFPWNATAAMLEESFAERIFSRNGVSPGNSGANVGRQVKVERRGRGDATSAFGYEHTLHFAGAAVMGDMQLVAASHLGLGHGSVFLPSRATLAGDATPVSKQWRSERPKYGGAWGVYNSYARFEEPEPPHSIGKHSAPLGTGRGLGADATSKAGKPYTMLFSASGGAGGGRFGRHEPSSSGPGRYTGATSGLYLVEYLGTASFRNESKVVHRLRWTFDGEKLIIEKHSSVRYHSPPIVHRPSNEAHTLHILSRHQIPLFLFLSLHFVASRRGRGKCSADTAA